MTALAVAPFLEGHRRRRIVVGGRRPGGGPIPDAWPPETGSCAVVWL